MQVDRRRIFDAPAVCFLGNTSTSKDRAGFGRLASARSLDLAARLRAFARDEAGVTTFECFLIAAFAGAACVVVLETLGFSLAGALGIGTRGHN